MKSITRTLAITALLFLAGMGGALAEFNNGNDLHKDCSTSQNEATYYQRAAACRSYVVGVVDAIEFFDYARNKKQTMVCTQNGVTQGQMTDIAKKYLSDHPESRHLPVAVIVFTAMSDAFPCK